MTDEPAACAHQWACPGAQTVPTENGMVIILPLFCTRCGEVTTRLAPPPEQPAASKIARAQALPPLSPNPQRR